MAGVRGLASPSAALAAAGQLVVLALFFFTPATTGEEQEGPSALTPFSILSPGQSEPRRAAGKLNRNSAAFDNTCNVVRFGARGNGVLFDTAAIQAAVDACAFRHGVVYFPPGRYLTATVFLKSNLTVHIDAGATILGSPRQSDYPRERRRWYVIMAEGAENVAVTGAGTLDGQGEKFVAVFDDQKNEMVSWNTTGECEGKECRPRLLGFLNCKNVRVTNIFLRDTAYWCFHLVSSTNTVISNVSIQGNFNSPNTDGIDVDSSNNTVITGCHIDTGDDAICAKTNDGPLLNLTVSDCWIRTKSSGVKLGSESVYLFQGLRFERMTISESHRGLGIQLRDSGSISDVVFANIEMSTRYYSVLWWGLAEPIYVTACPREPQTAVGTISDVHFINISSTSENGIFMAGSRQSSLTSISFQNVSMTYLNSASSTENKYHDYRPGCREVIAHSSSGLYAEYVSELSLKEVSFVWGPNVSWNLPFEFIPQTVGSLDVVYFASSTEMPAKVADDDLLHLA